MKKWTIALAFLAIVSCKFDENGNKMVLPESEELGIQEHKVADDEHSETSIDENITSEDGQLDEFGNYVYNVGESTYITLPNGTRLEVGSNSTENRLYSMLADDNININEEDKTIGWITLDRVYFETGSDALTAASKDQIDHIVSILEAYPQAEIKLGGYTDNTGSQEINQPLSEGRAKSVLNNIVQKGIDSNRLNAEGYGSDHAVCPENDTEICKAKNRRVDIRLSKK